jgi:hypothetical protein
MIGGRGRVKVQVGKSGIYDGLENKNKTIDEIIFPMSTVGDSSAESSKFCEGKENLDKC